MAIDPNRLLGHVFPEIRREYLERDAILYALGIGLGADRLDATDLNFLLEKRLNHLPTLAVTLASSAGGTLAWSIPRSTLPSLAGWSAARSLDRPNALTKPSQALYRRISRC
jgi:hypothetical protein